MEILWRQAENSLPEEEALSQLFGDDLRSYKIARYLYDWLKRVLPFRCGVRLGKDRITFLVGNYRPAALKKENKGKVRLEMGFVNNLPENFKPTTFVWRSLSNVIEGYIIVADTSFSISEEAQKNFIKACEQMLEVASKSKKHLCNVLAACPDKF